MSEDLKIHQLAMAVLKAENALFSAHDGMGHKCRFCDKTIAGARNYVEHLRGSHLCVYEYCGFAGTDEDVNEHVKKEHAPADV